MFMFDIAVFGILAGLAGLVAYEIYQETRSGSETWHDHYHE